MVLSAYLDGHADRRTLAVLASHEPLVASAITIAAVATRSAEESDQMLDALASRAAIEQAKGTVMTLRRCDTDEAWQVLRLTSQQCNVKLRELALALVEYVGGVPAQQQGDPDRRVTVGPDAHAAAALLWLALTEPAAPTAYQAAGD
ncbi:MAG TPA: ANTAR domain-containing protein [Pseudonocardiaceae bacterium]|nr:ANTAR domain-containing protein [Pseudonocardiaceae bacterium]